MFTDICIALLVDHLSINRSVKVVIRLDDHINPYITEQFNK